MSIPGSTNPLLLFGDPTGGQYQIQRSLRFNASDSGFCSRTPAVAGNRRTFTLAGWVKRSTLSAAGYKHIFSTGTVLSEAGYFSISFWEDKLDITTGAADLRKTSAVYRDTSAWYHVVVAVDTTQATAANRVKVYVNGEEVTAFQTNANPTQNADLAVNNTGAHSIGRNTYNSSDYFDGYLADIHFIDGQALTPSSFTEVSATTGQLIPKAYTGTFGTNGFWLKFSDNSAATAAALGNDYSGNNNDWTPNNLSVTAGAGNDSLVDTPTSFGTDTGVGGEVRGNYCCINPNDKNNGASVDLKDGNLEYVVSAAGQHGCRRSTFALSSSKWYAECTIKVATGGTDRIGILSASQADFVTNSNPSIGFFSQGYAYMSNGQKENNNVSVSYGASYTTNDVIGIALDMDAGTVTFYKNGSSQGQAYSGLSGAFCFAGSPFNGGTHVWNFGQRAFAYTAPSGFKALCDTNLPAPLTAKPNTLMDVKLYTGNGSTQTISGLGFSPDLVWIKRRDSAANHALFDVVRGTGKFLESSSTNAEATSANSLTAFNSDGFSLGTYSQTNTNSATYATWAWDAGTSTVSNTAGSITSQVRANVSAGFSIVTLTYSSVNGTVGHGLGVAPQMIIAKRRNTTGNWYVAHTGLTSMSGHYLELESTAAQGAAGWGGAPTSTVFNMANSIFGPGDYVAYCFAPVVGYSSFGSYVGNGSSDGPMVYTGFRPRWILIKNSSATADWSLFDTARDSYNQALTLLAPNLSAADNVLGSGLDILSNGFKLRRDASPAINASSNTFVYAAFAENPFQYARAR